MKKYFTLLLLALLMGTLIKGQDLEQNELPEQPTENIWRIGVHLSPTTGTGFSFKYVRNDRHEFQLVTLPFYLSGGGISLHSGFNYYYKFLDLKAIDFLVFAGGTYGYDQIDLNPSTIIFDELMDGPYYLDNDLHNMNFTGGVGLQLGRKPVKKMSVLVGYSLYNLTNDFKTLLSIGLTFELGVL